MDIKPSHLAKKIRNNTIKELFSRTFANEWPDCATGWDRLRGLHFHAKIVHVQELSNLNQVELRQL